MDPTTAEVSTVTVPRKWDDNFKAFNEVIKESGLDLSRVKNKKVDKWVVLIPAQSTETQKSYGVVLVYKNEARGAYILQKPSGEVLPLKAAGAHGGKPCADRRRSGGKRGLWRRLSRRMIPQPPRARA